ncbi:MAG: hypothetical protein Q8P18_16110 [Pseudomonadota bacterium]|nr:hypothetical protein [Pseudomonadota bacterium]
MRLNILFATLLVCLAAPRPASAGSDLKARIAKDRVQFVDGKMKIEEFHLCKVTVPGTSKSSLQMRSYAEVPVNAGVSRDFLVSFESGMQALMRITIGAALSKGSKVEPHKALDCDPISAPIGKVDLEVNLYLTADGFQMAFVDASTGTTMQESRRWDDESK